MGRPAGSAKLLRAINSSAALSHLLDRGRLTRSDLRELTGLSKPTSSEMLRLLADAGLAMVAGRTSGGPGPTAEIYSPNPDAAYVVALSVREPGEPGRAAIAGAMADLAGTERARIEVDHSRKDPVDTVRAALDAICRQSHIPIDRIKHVQLGVPGSYDPHTDTIHHIDVPGWQAPGLLSRIKRRQKMNVSLDNDVNLAAVAERSRGVAAGVDAFALLWLEEGVGLATVLSGTLLRGSRGGAGEIGYIPLRPESGPASAREPAPGSAAGSTGGGRTGAPRDLQDLVGGAAVTALARTHRLRARTAADAVRAAVTASADATGPAAFLDELARRVAFALAPVIAVLDPPLVVLAGPLALAGGDVLREKVAAALHLTAPLETQLATTAVTDDPVLLGGLDAGLLTLRESLIAALAKPSSTPP